MLSRGRVLRKRAKTPYLIKYLEGVPTPSTMIDHIAGANLHVGSASSSNSGSLSLFLFSTTPRYIHRGVRQRGGSEGDRLSSLFFHHVLYPAGGARRPCQPVVVRQGRQVRSLAYRAKQLPVTAEPSGSAASAIAASNSHPPSPSAASADPLAVPAAQDPTRGPSPARLVSTSAAEHHTVSDTATDRWATSSQDLLRVLEGGANASGWARSDPARRPYFYPTPLQRNAGDGDLDGTGSSPANDPHAAPRRRGEADDGMGRPHFKVYHTHSDPRAYNPAREATAAMRASPTSSRTAATHPTGAATAGSRGIRVQRDEVMAPFCSVAEAALEAALQIDRDGKQLPRPGHSETLLKDNDFPLVDRNGGLLLFTKKAETPLANVLPFNLSSSTGTENGGSSSRSGRALKRTDAEDPLKPSRSAVLDTLATSAAAAARNYFYVQTAVPAAAVARIVVESGDESDALSTTAASRAQRRRFELWRLAGGVEPYVGFAVGSPLARTPADQKRGDNGNPFSHLTCLARVSFDASAASSDLSDETTETGSMMLACAQDTQSSGGGRRVARFNDEEARTLGPKLDPVLSATARTLAEPVPALRVQGPTATDSRATEAGEVLVGSQDAEMYVLPQRELLLEVVVSREVTDACCASNTQRAAFVTQRPHSLHSPRPWGTQSADSSASQPSADRGATNSAAEPSSAAGGGAASQDASYASKGRAAAARLLRTRFRNAQEAMAERQRRAEAQLTADDVEEQRGREGPSSSKCPPPPSSEAASPREEHAIRALPGDVVYIPRGCGVRVRRLAGTTFRQGRLSDDGTEAASGNAVQQQRGAKGIQDDGDFSADDSSHSQQQQRDRVERYMRSMPLSRPTFTSRATPYSAADREAMGEALQDGAAFAATRQAHTHTISGSGTPRYTAVEVDALVLHYQPYPVLSAAQAAVYVPANYVHRGIDDFYRSGGNDVFHKYV